MLFEWSASHGAPAKGKILTWVVIDNTLHAAVRLDDGRVLSVAAYRGKTIMEPAEPEDPLLYGIMLRIAEAVADGPATTTGMSEGGVG